MLLQTPAHTDLQSCHIALACNFGHFSMASKILFLRIVGLFFVKVNFLKRRKTYAAQ